MRSCWKGAAQQEETLHMPGRAAIGPSAAPNARGCRQRPWERYEHAMCSFPSNRTDSRRCPQCTTALCGNHRRKTLRDKALGVSIWSSVCCLTEEMLRLEHSQTCKHRADAQPALLPYRILTPFSAVPNAPESRRAGGAAQSSAAARAEEQSPPRSAPCRTRRRDTACRVQPRAASLTPAESRSWPRRLRGQRSVLLGAARCCPTPPLASHAVARTRDCGAGPTAEQRRPPQRPRAAGTARPPVSGSRFSQRAAVRASAARGRRSFPLRLPQGLRSAPPNPRCRYALPSAHFRLLLVGVDPKFIQYLRSLPPPYVCGLPPAAH